MRKNMTFFKHCRRAGRFSTFLARSIFLPPKSRPKRKTNFLVAIFFPGTGMLAQHKHGMWNLNRPNQIRYDLCICRQICIRGDSSYNFWSRSTSLSQPTSLFNVVPTNRCKTRKYTIEQKNHQTTTNLSKFEKEIYVGICSDLHQCATSF